MLNNQPLGAQQFTDLERRLWKEAVTESHGNPLCEELVSTRDTLLSLINEAQGVYAKYASDLSTLADHADLEYFKEWDNFGDTLDNLDYELEGN